MISSSLYSWKNKTTLFKFFFFLLVLEACLGGSGRLLEIGAGITIRKINFFVGLLMSVGILLYVKKVRKEIAFIIITFIITLVIATFIGFLNYGKNEKVFENVQIQSFFLLLPLYTFFIKDDYDIRIVTSIIKISAIIMSVVYLSVLALMLAGVIQFTDLYTLIEDSADFMARGESGFWYKGFLYLCIALFFFDIEKNVYLKRLKEFLVVVAIYFTFARGFILALFITFFLHQLFFKSILKSMAILLGLLLIVSLLGQFYEAASFDRYESDIIRELQFKQVVAAIDPVSWIFGHGFGEGVAIRDNHMEINYLEIFHKQGVVGLVFWFSLLVYVFIQYINCTRRGYEKKARPFFLAALFIYLESATNPFLTNSIGLNMLMLSIVSLNVYLDKGSNLHFDGN